MNCDNQPYNISWINYCGTSNFNADRVSMEGNTIGSIGLSIFITLTFEPSDR